MAQRHAAEAHRGREHHQYKTVDQHAADKLGADTPLRC
jgi:hypothetical protein